MLVSLVLILIYAAIPGAVAYAGVVLMVRGTLLGAVGGALLVVLGGYIALLTANAYPIGIAGAAIGACYATVRYRRTAGWSPRLLFAAAAVVVLVAEPVLLINVAEVQANETYDRCAAEMAVAVVERSRAQGRGYPPDMHEISLADGEYGVGPCYVSNGVNWLYRVAAPGTYTLGYWVDWRVTRHVCLHTARTQGWTCGFETWGPFQPGEVD